MNKTILEQGAKINGLENNLVNSHDGSFAEFQNKNSIKCLLNGQTRIQKDYLPMHQRKPFPLDEVKLSSVISDLKNNQTDRIKEILNIQRKNSNHSCESQRKTGHSRNNKRSHLNLPNVVAKSWDSQNFRENKLFRTAEVNKSIATSRHTVLTQHK